MKLYSQITFIRAEMCSRLSKVTRTAEPTGAMKVKTVNHNSEQTTTLPSHDNI